MIYNEAIADLDLGHLGLQRTASTCPFLGDPDRFYTIVEGMIAPGVWRAAPPALPTAFIVGDGLLGIGDAGKPPRFHVLHVLCQPLGFLSLGGGIRY
jgi:hypothetical protein